MVTKPKKKRVVKIKPPTEVVPEKIVVQPWTEVVIQPPAEIVPEPITFKPCPYCREDKDSPSTTGCPMKSHGTRI